ncbi:MAG: haloacid dehalogenase-like hydrolase, partial [Prochlorococcaceae cyanobacterium]
MAIHQFIGRRPVLCCGNSDGDLAILHHTDAEREWAYDSHSRSTGTLVEALAQAPERGWIVVDMARDWTTV